MAARGARTELRNYTADKPPWYTDGNGDIKIQSPRFIADPAGGKGQLSPASRIAIALSMGCCKLGRGKVIVLHPGPKLPVGGARWQEPDTLLARVPSLFYMDYTWTSDEQAEWSRMDPLDHLSLLDSCHYGVPSSTPVLPFDAQIDAEQSVNPRLEDFRSGPVTVYLTPTPYVGIRSAMLKACRQELSKQAWVCHDGWESFSPWRADRGVMGVVQELQTLYERNDFSLVHSFEVLRSRHIRACEEVAILRRPQSQT